MSDMKHTADHYEMGPLALNRWTIEDGALDVAEITIKDGESLPGTFGEIEIQYAEWLVECVNECAGLTVAEIRDAINLYREGDWS